MLIHSVKNGECLIKKHIFSEWFKRLIKRWLYTHGYTNLIYSFHLYLGQIIDSPLGGLVTTCDSIAACPTPRISVHNQQDMDLPNKCGYHQPLDDQPLGYFQHFVPDPQNSDGCRSTWCSPRTWIGQSGAQVPLVPFGDRTLEDFTKMESLPKMGLTKTPRCLVVSTMFFHVFSTLALGWWFTVSWLMGLKPPSRNAFWYTIRPTDQQLSYSYGLKRKPNPTSQDSIIFPR